MAHDFKISDEQYAKLAAYAAQWKQTPETLFQEWVRAVTRSLVDILPSPEGRRDSHSHKWAFLLRWRLQSMSISMFPSYVASTGMTFRKPCGSSQSDVCGNLVIVPSLPTWFSLAVVERECTLVDTVVFLPKKPNYLGTHKHYSVIKVLRISSRTGVKKWKEFLCLRAAALSSLPLNGEGLPAPIDKRQNFVALLLHQLFAVGLNIQTQKR